MSLLAERFACEGNQAGRSPISKTREHANGSNIMKIAISTSAALCLALGAAAAPSVLPPPPSSPVEAMPASETCANDTVDIYFGQNETELTAQSERLIEYVAQTYATCNVDRISVEGFADIEGDTFEAATLASARAEAVIDAIEEAELAPGKVERASADAILELGESETASLMNRKAVIQISVTPKSSKYAGLAQR